MRRNPPTRRRGDLPTKHTVLVYCGGLRTEPEYFDGLKLENRSSAVSVRIVAEGADPERLVRRAAGHRNRQPGVFDEVWCVTDVDQFDLTRAVALARKERVSLAVSNPCFELWLLLHHADCTAHCTGYDDVATRLKKYVRDYDKCRLNFAAYRDKIDDAVERARKLDPDGTAFTANPSTNVWQLVERIRAS
ncbi:RloB family protein [Virgisporangium aurantiacum]|uniref:RloB-like protein n=1 Tax=Virgisporangium aurantiacum TaxID=175570 RepID=A0A8J4E033_9ACTN|nr:RloB family protein [Virgisporangium aurantiacum]GIJ56589.1 hypothetical protein Vau01_041050 [Virgisporangium aurantiacum]